MAPTPARVEGGERSGDLGPTGGSRSGSSIWPPSSRGSVFRDFAFSRRLDPTPALPAARRRPPTANALAVGPWSIGFWGDERFVPWDHPDSKLREWCGQRWLARGARPAAKHSRYRDGRHAAPTPPAPMNGYLKILLLGPRRWDPARALFDVEILGLGPDGHQQHRCFPGTSVLEERDRWVAEVIGARAEGPASPLTYPVLESSRHSAFLVAGRERSEKC